VSANVRSTSRVIVFVVAAAFTVFPTQGAVYEWQLSEKQALSIANSALAANHIKRSRYRWHQRVWRIIDTREWFCRLDFIQVSDFPSAIRVFALTHSRRIVFQR